MNGPTIVCAQAGNVNGGAVDPFGYIRDVVDRRTTDDIWLHVDGAFGLWVRAEPSRRHSLTVSSGPTRGRPTPTSG